MLMSKFVVVDFEMCDVPRGAVRERYNQGKEIIEIGAVLLDEALEVIDDFKSFVSPEYGYINDRIHRLTNISVEDVAQAPCFRDAFEMFLSWIPEDAVPVSWSENDLYQVRYESRCKNVSIPALDALLDSWLDCQKTFAEKMKSKRCYNLTEALRLSGIDYEDGEHDALVDARNTAMLFVKMKREPELQLSRYYTQQSEEPLTSKPFADLFAKFSFAV